jgi:hypothetical protein
LDFIGAEAARTLWQRYGTRHEIVSRRLCATRKAGIVQMLTVVAAFPLRHHGTECDLTNCRIYQIHASPETEAMRSNPFLDLWQFLTELTHAPYAEGVFAYGFVVLFFGLLAAAAVIARANWREDPSQRTSVHLVTCVVRVLIGCMWFKACLSKLPLPASEGLRYWTEQMAQYAAFGLHRELVTSVYLPYLNIIGPIVFLAELSFAVSLILGFGVPFFGLLATLFSVHLWLGLYLQPGEWPWAYISLAVVHLQFIVSSAGRSLGLDALFHRHDVTGFARAFG